MCVCLGLLKVISDFPKYCCASAGVYMGISHYQAHRNIEQYLYIYTYMNTHTYIYDNKIYDYTIYIIYTTENIYGIL